MPTTPAALVSYPINDFGPVMKGMVIGGLGILHVFLAQFAIGGGILMARFQWLAMKGREPAARRLLDSYFRYLVLVSFVVGALTGVGMWFTSIQVSPVTIGRMVDVFHWVWATEWLFFWVEVIAGYAFYRYAKILSDRTRLALLVIYSIAGWGSLFWINGILSWQLTPGEWVRTGDIWSGFFNPTFWPSLLYRTVAATVIAGLVAAVVVNTMPDVSREDRTRLINRAAGFMLPIAAMPVLGVWFLAAMPEDSRQWVLGGSAAMTLFMNIAVGSSVLLGGYVVIGLWRQKLYINGATATLLLALAFGATAGGEFVREGVRKPYTIREVLFSNAVSPDQVEHLRVVGCTTNDPFPLRGAAAFPNRQLQLGALTFRNQCAVCHTVRGVNGLTHLMGSWSLEQQRMNVAKLQFTKGFMPPFAGTPNELEALVQYVRWETRGRPGHWPESDDPRALTRIQAWLDEAGTRPATEARLTTPASAPSASESAASPRLTAGHPLPLRRPTEPGAMNALFPLNLPAPTFWYVVLYIVTLLLHVAFMAYVLAGAILLGVAGLRGMLRPTPRSSAWTPVTTVLKDWMPFVLSAAITAGIAPLLFVQILYQQEFYTANLLSFHRWMAILPVLIVAFYLLYLLKARRIEGRTALQGTAAVLVMGAILFVAWSWIENHLLSLDRGAWAALYESRAMVYASPAIAPRLGFWIASGFATASVLLAWQLRARASGISVEAGAHALRPLARLGAAATIAALLAAVPTLGLGKADGGPGPLAGIAHLVVPAAGGGLLAAIGLVFASLRPATPRAGLIVASLGIGLFWVGVLAAREAARLGTIGLENLVERHERVGTLAGLGVFLVFAIVGLGTIAWVVRAVLRPPSTGQVSGECV